MNVKIDKELRIMHACELGAVGVYRGHKCVARYFFRRSIADLDHMRSHEKSHAEIFSVILSERGMRFCFAHKAFFWAGLFYGVAVGILGLKAIGVSTFTVETIVERELNAAIKKLRHEQEIIEVLQAVLKDEQEHQSAGLTLSENGGVLSVFAEKAARIGAYTAKYAASAL